MTKTILILGCGTMQIPALRIARDMGWNVIAVDGNPEAEGRDLCDVFHPVDLKDVPGLIQVAQGIRNDRGLDGVFTAGTDFSASVAAIAEALDLPGHSLEAAQRATDKVLMRRSFQEAGVPSPLFLEVDSQADYRIVTQAISGPWVVKPVDSMGARGVKRIDRPTDLPDALEEARRYSRSGRALVEQFMEGPEFSLDALVDDSEVTVCGIADRHIVYPPHFIEIGHTIPSSFSLEDQKRITDVFIQGIHALGLTRGAAKGDIKLTPHGPMVGEIAARLSGGYMSGWTMPYASGLEPTRGGLRLAVGLDAGFDDPPLNLFCAERAVIGIDGRVLSLRGLEEAKAIPGVRDVFLRYAPGQVVSFPRNNVEKIGNVIAVGRTAEEAEAVALRALSVIQVELDPRDKRTGSYLDGDGPFPPDLCPLADYSNAEGLLGLWRDFPPRPSMGCPDAPLLLKSWSEIDSLLDSDPSGRRPSEILDILTEEGLVQIVDHEERNQAVSDFWKALNRGGLPGARWFLCQAN